MATITAKRTVGKVLVISTNTNPALGIGTPAPIGSIAIVSDGNGQFFKVGALDTDWSKTPMPQNVALVDGPSISLDASLGNVFTVTLGGNRTLANPTNPINGQKIVVIVNQDGTGSRTLTLDTAYAFGTDIPSLNLSTTANAKDFLGFIYRSSISKWCFVSLIRGF